MTTCDLSLQTNSVNTQCLEVRFIKTDDRWSHELWLVGETSKVLLLASVEGTDQQAWPSSPPIQDVDEHTVGTDFTAILGVGMAGRGHWSASISHRENRLEFDLACLTNQPDGWLGSTYQILPDCPQTAPDAALDESVSVNEGLVAMKFDDITIEIGTVSGIRRSQFSRIDRQLMIEPAQRSAKPKSATQWAYQIRVTD